MTATNPTLLDTILTAAGLPVDVFNAYQQQAMWLSFTEPQFDFLRVLLTEKERVISELARANGRAQIELGAVRWGQ